jgi:hypothetical protein
MSVHTHDTNIADLAPASVPLANLSMIDPKLQKRLIGRIEADEEMPRDLAERILDQALGYLKLAAEQPEGHYSPSPLVDIGWHTFILYTREYGNFCRELTNGRFIHHEPTDEEGVENLSSGPAGTMEAMRQAGIVVDEPLWAHMHAGDCSNCNGGQGCQCGSCNY